MWAVSVSEVPLGSGGCCEGGEFNVGQDAELLHVWESADPSQRDVACSEHGDPRRQDGCLVAEREEFAGTGVLTEAGCEVDRPADVVISVDDEDLAVCDTAPSTRGDRSRNAR